MAFSSRRLPVAAALFVACFGCEGLESREEPPPAEPPVEVPDVEEEVEAAEAEEALLEEPPPPEPATGPPRNRTVYVPAYSAIGSGDRPTLLSVTLSVRNVDPGAEVRLTHVDYFDTAGERVRRYLEEPRTLQPLQTAEFHVEALDEAGGTGANFLVHWEGPEDAHPLLTETVMVGHAGTGYLSFTSRGVELERPLPDGEPAP